jgi:hypothetical protein
VACQVPDNTCSHDLANSQRPRHGSALAPSYDLDNHLIHVGTAAGVFYAVPVPLP